MWEAEGLLGHKMPSTSERYAQFDPSWLSGAAGAIDDYLRASNTGAAQRATEKYREQSEGYW